MKQALPTKRFLYTVNLRDARTGPGGQDGMRPTRLLIEAASAELARAWGDALAHVRCHDKDRPLRFLSSVVEDGDGMTPSDGLPLVRFGETPSGDAIEWEW